jgi:hypothetical protein
LRQGAASGAGSASGNAGCGFSGVSGSLQDSVPFFFIDLTLFGEQLELAFFIEAEEFAREFAVGGGFGGFVFGFGIQFYGRCRGFRRRLTIRSQFCLLSFASRAEAGDHFVVQAINVMEEEFGKARFFGRQCGLLFLSCGLDLAAFGEAGGAFGEAGLVFTVDCDADGSFGLDFAELVEGPMEVAVGGVAGAFDGAAGFFGGFVEQRVRRQEAATISAARAVSMWPSGPSSE